MTTEKQQVILDEMRKLGEQRINPTVRSLADRLETRRHRSERFSDDEVRGLLERLEEAGHVHQFEDDDGEQRYELVEPPAA